VIVPDDESHPGVTKITQAVKENQRAIHIVITNRVRLSYSPTPDGPKTSQQIEAFGCRRPDPTAGVYAVTWQQSTSFQVDDNSCNGH